MATRTQILEAKLSTSGVRAFAANERMNQLLIEHLDPAVWSAKLSAQASDAPRTIAAIFTHMHNVRTKWIRLNAPHVKVPAQLNRARATPQEACAALAESADCCAHMLADALDGKGRMKHFLRDGWAQPWPVGVEMLCYMVAHEAHHRGQVCMLTHQLGFPLPNKVTSELWNWERMWKKRGASHGPGYNA